MMNPFASNKSLLNPSAIIKLFKKDEVAQAFEDTQSATAGEGVVDPTKEPGWEPALETKPWSKPDETTGISTHTDPVTGTESIYQGEPQLPEMDDEGNIVGNKLKHGDITPQTVGGGYGKKRIEEQSRKQANLTGSRGSSILTA